MGFSACCSVGHGTDLLEKREIVFQMPVVGDPAFADTQDVGGDEIDWLAGAHVSHESAGEMAGEAHMRDDSVSHYQPLYNHYLQIWDRRGNPWRPVRARWAPACGHAAMCGLRNPARSR